jgi:hypothetical protein
MSSSMLTSLAFDSVGRSALLLVDREPRTGSKRSWTLKRTSQSHTPSITTVPGVPEPLKASQTSAMVIRTVLSAPRMARPVRTDPSSVEVPPSMDRSDAAVPSHFRGVARAGMTVGPLSIQPAGAILTIEPTATHEQAVLKIRKPPPKFIFKI